MKTLVLTVSLTLVGVSSAEAQMFRPSTAAGAVVGAVAGGLIGGHNGDRWAEGLLIGAVAGGLVGSAVAPQPPVYYPTQTVYGQPTAVIQTPTVPNAPVVADAPVAVPQPPPQVVYAPAPQVVYAPAPQPQVVYVERAPQVVYVPARPVYVERRPSISIGLGIYSGPRYHPGYRHDHYYRGYSGRPAYGRVCR